MFYRITVVNWSHFIPRNDKSTEGTVKSSQAAYYTGTTDIHLGVWHRECSREKETC